MNVYDKLNLARIQFQNVNKKMSGKNSFAGYSYYELADILPEINIICNNIKAACIVRYEKDMAFLEFVDCEKPEDKITFSSPMSEANLKGCHAVQNLGAVETYVKRYLYQACFEIVENDCLDQTMNPNQNDTKNQNTQPKQPKQPAFEPKGGESTPEEKARIETLLAAKYPNGSPVFSRQEMITYSGYRKEKTAAELITFIENALRNRLPEATELQSFPEEIPWK